MRRKESAKRAQRKCGHKPSLVHRQASFSVVQLYAQGPVAASTGECSNSRLPPHHSMAGMTVAVPQRRKESAVKQFPRLSTTLLVIGSGLILTGVAWSAENGISKTPMPAESSVISGFRRSARTLCSDRHTLKDAGSGDIVDIYAPCEYDPFRQGRSRAPTNASPPSAQSSTL